MEPYRKIPSQGREGPQSEGKRRSQSMSYDHWKTTNPDDGRGAYDDLEVMAAQELTELRALNDELLSELSNLSDFARVVMLRANNLGARYDIDGLLESSETAIAKAEARK